MGIRAGHLIAKPRVYVLCRQVLRGPQDLGYAHEPGEHTHYLETPSLNPHDAVDLSVSSYMPRLVYA